MKRARRDLGGGVSDKNTAHGQQECTELRGGGGVRKERHSNCQPSNVIILSTAYLDKDREVFDCMR